MHAHASKPFSTQPGGHPREPRKRGQKQNVCRRRPEAQECTSANPAFATKPAHHRRTYATGATDKANDLVSGALETVGGNINSTLGSFVKKVNGFAAHVNETASSVKVGVASVLAQAFDRAPNGTVSEEDRARVFSMLGQADEVVQTALVSVTGATATLDVVPQAVANVTEKAKDALAMPCAAMPPAL